MLVQSLWRHVIQSSATYVQEISGWLHAHFNTTPNEVYTCFRVDLFMQWCNCLVLFFPSLFPLSDLPPLVSFFFFSSPIISHSLHPSVYTETWQPGTSWSQRATSWRSLTLAWPGTSITSTTIKRRLMWVLNLHAAHWGMCTSRECNVFESHSVRLVHPSLFSLNPSLPSSFCFTLSLGWCLGRSCGFPGSLWM